MMGYEDNSASFPNMYTGPANGGVCPMNNVIYWGSTTYPGGTCGESPISVSHNGIDGRTTRGHVGDYWVDIESNQQDPYITGSWTPHSNDSLGDFMATSHSAKSNIDGSTIFFYYNDGSRTYDFTGAEPGQIDGCHGVKLFVEHCGYSVEALGNYNQYIYGFEGRSQGFTFENYKSEIDAGRPVLIHVSGHTMLGFGYDDTGQKVYLRDTWDHNSHEMAWGGNYGSMQHYGVSVIQLMGGGTPTVDTPTISPNGGSYPTSVSVTISCSTSGAEIRYTTDGSSPVSSSTLYSSAFTLTTTTTVNTRGFKSGYSDSSVASATFTIGSSPPPPSSLVIDKLKGKINWKNSPCIGSDTIKCSMQTTLTDLSFLENCPNMWDLFTMDSGAGTVTGLSGEFLKINGKKNKVIMKLKAPSGYSVKTIMKLKDNQLTVTRKMKNGVSSDVKFDVSNTDCAWQTKTVNIDFKCSAGGTTITNSGIKTINYKTKADKKTIIK